MFANKIEPVISPTTQPLQTPKDTLSAPQCLNCRAKFGFMKSRKVCLFCQLAYCRKCIKSCERNVYKITHNASRVQMSLIPVKVCTCCYVLSSPDARFDEVMKIDVKHLKLYLSNKNERIIGIKEKTELAEQVLKVNRRVAQNSSSAEANSNTRHTFTPLSNATSSSPNRNSQSANNQNANQNSAPQYQSMFNLSSGSTSTSPSNQTNLPTPEQQRAFEMLNEILGRPVFNTSTRHSDQSQSTNSSNSDANETRPSSHPALNRVRSSSGEHGTSNADPGLSAATSTPNIKETSPTTARRRASLSDLKSEEDIENLTIRQIKEILAFNFVDYKGCFERSELVQKLKILYASNAKNQKLLNEMNDTSNANPTRNASPTSKSCQNLNNINSGESEEKPPIEVCKICMDNAIDCVLLNCGHMVSCVKCGKVLAECPICRQNIVKVVRVFKA